MALGACIKGASYGGRREIWATRSVRVFVKQESLLSLGLGGCSEGHV